jgi:predicted LPLAT superfamily acyltransferase
VASRISRRAADRYEAHVEVLSDRLELPRANRDEILRACVQEYADRLAARVRAEPYNWLNFFDFWAK